MQPHWFCNGNRGRPCCVVKCGPRSPSQLPYGFSQPVGKVAGSCRSQAAGGQAGKGAAGSRGGGKVCRGACVVDSVAPVGQGLPGLLQDGGGRARTHCSAGLAGGLPGAGDITRAERLWAAGSLCTKKDLHGCHRPFRLGKHSPVQNGGGAAHLARVEPDSAPPHPDPKSGPQKSLPWLDRGRTGISRLLTAGAQRVDAQDCQVLRNLRRRGHTAQFLPVAGSHPEYFIF